MVQAEVCLPDSLTKHCPFCADTILPAGIKCRYCGEKFDPPSALAAITPDSTNDSSRHKTMIVMLITAVCSIPIFMLTLEAITRLGGGRGVPERLFVGGALAA